MKEINEVAKKFTHEVIKRFEPEIELAVEEGVKNYIQQELSNFINRQIKASLNEYHFKSELKAKIQESFIEKLNVDKIIKDKLKEIK